MAVLEIDKASIKKNTRWFLDLAKKNKLKLTAVTKFCGSEPALVKILKDSGVVSIADSNIQNFQKKEIIDLTLKNGEICKSLIKTRLSDIVLFPKLSPKARPDRVFTSDTKILEEVRKLPFPMRPELVLIVEIGDLKEGLFPEEIPGIVREFSDLPIIGVSANFACMSGKMPDLETIGILESLANEIKEKQHLQKRFISIGGTVVTPMLQEGFFAGRISEIRIGEGIFFGHDSSGGRDIPGLSNKTFTLKGEIIEIKEKKIVLSNERGYNALGDVNASRQDGYRKCAVLDFGILGARSLDLFPRDEDIKIAGQTYDYTVVDVTDSIKIYETENYIEFQVYYAGASQAFLNHYVLKTVR